MGRRTAWPYVVVAFVPGAFAALAYALSGGIGPAYDFTRDGAVIVHIADRALTPLPIVQNAPGAAWLVLAYVACYAVAYPAYECALRRLRPRLAVAAFALAVLGALAVPFLPTSDPYAYALYAVEAGPLHLDPYVSHALAPNAGPWLDTLTRIFPTTDAYVRHANYGPTFLFFYAGLATLLAHASLGTFLLAERVLGAAGIVATAWALALAGRRSGDERFARAATFALHPLVIFEFVAFAHGDTLMFAALAWAFVAWRRERYGLAGLLCGAAIGARSVALLALIAAVVAAVRGRRRHAAVSTVAGAGVALGALGTLSVLVYGDASLGGAPIFNAFSAPLVAAAVFAGGSGAIAVGVVAEAALGAILTLVVLRRWWLGTLRAAPAWLPLAALAGLPTVYPHYLAWFTSMRGLTDDARVARAARAVSLVAPVLYVTHQNVFSAPGPPVEAYLAVLAVVWGVVIVSLGAAAPRTRPVEQAA